MIKVPQEVKDWLDENKEVLRGLFEQGYEVEAEEEKREFWKPNDKEVYFFIEDNGGVASGKHDVFDDYHYAFFEIGNAFKTEEEAEFEAERIKVYRELKLWASEFRVHELNYYLYYDHIAEGFYITYSTFHQRSPLCFDSIETAQKAIDAVGEERIKKYYLGVEEG